MATPDPKLQYRLSWIRTYGIRHHIPKSTYLYCIFHVVNNFVDNFNKYMNIAIYNFVWFSYLYNLGMSFLYGFVVDLVFICIVLVRRLVYHYIVVYIYILVVLLLVVYICSNGCCCPVVCGSVSG